MIYILDDFIDKKLFEIANDYLKKGSWTEKKAGDKNFYIQESNEEFDNYILNKLSKFEGKKLYNILSFLECLMLSLMMTGEYMQTLR